MDNKVLYKKLYTKIAKVLLKAVEMPYYKSTIPFSKDEIKAGITYEQFCTIPYVTKDIYRDSVFDMVDQKFGAKKEEYFKYGMDYNSKKNYLLQHNLYVKVTSGSTGMPMEVIKSVEDIRRDYFSLSFYRSKNLKKDLKGNFLWIWPTNRFTRKYFYEERENYYQVNRYGYQYMVAEYSDDVFENLYQFMIQKNILWITSSPSMLVCFSEYINRLNKEKISLEYVECHSEILLPWQKEIICECFDTEPVSIYSSNEVQFMGMTCDKNHLHLLTRNAFIEFATSEKNEVVVTSLNNFDVPLIRYSLGDCGRWIKCDDCNMKKYPAFSLEKFRKKDHLVCKNGIRYEPFVVYDSITFLKAKFLLDIRQYSVVQKELHKLCYYFDHDCDNEMVHNMLRFLKDYYYEVTGENMEIVILPFEKVFLAVGTRKFSYFISEVR